MRRRRALAAPLPGAPRINGTDTAGTRGANEIAALAMRTRNVIARGERQRRAGASESGRYRGEHDAWLIAALAMRTQNAGGVRQRRAAAGEGCRNLTNQRRSRSRGFEWPKERATAYTEVETGGAWSWRSRHKPCSIQ